MKHIKYYDSKHGVMRSRVRLTEYEQHDLAKRNLEFITCNKLSEITDSEWQTLYKDAVSFSDAQVLQS